MSIEEKTVIVTGASRGLGRAIAAAFLRHGAYVVATGRDPRALAETGVTLQTIGKHYRLQPLEVTDEAAVVSFIASVEVIDILVNNAGIARHGPALETDTQCLREVLEVNVIAPFVLMREVIRKMVPAGGGQIINVASDAAVRGIARMAPYVASKHALLGLGRAFAREFRGQGIRVTTYCPGPIDTAILGSRNPAALNPEDVAESIVQLAALPPEMEVREMLVEPMNMDIV
jgi:NAD(P)-dependent dehydrogenase (short-subunit alcohol dehydrogenase family)